MTLVDIAEAGGVSELVRQLDAGADIDERAADGRVALHAALAEGHHHVAIVLLERGANPQLLDDNGSGLLHWAVYANDREILEIAYRASNLTSVDVEDLDGATPLSLAACGDSVISIDWLLRHGADPNHAESDGWTALHHAAGSGHVAAVRRLEGGARAMRRLSPPPGDTFGHLASDLARHYHPNCIEILALLEAAEEVECDDPPTFN